MDLPKIALKFAGANGAAGAFAMAAKAQFTI
jgi:hypothetical protein